MPKIKKKHSADVWNKAVIRVLDAAIQNDLVVSPVGVEYFIQNYLDFNHCVCRVDRKVCPCPELMSDINEMGHCECRLYWKSYQEYIEQMIKPNLT